MNRANRAFWDARKDAYPFHAETPTAINPAFVPNDPPHASTVLRAGWRTWGFTSEEARDHFCVVYGGFKL